MSKHLQKLFALVLVCCAFLGSSTAWGQINLQQSPYSENFDGMSTSYPNGWTGLRLAGSGTLGAALNPVETDGGASSGAVYSVGTTTTDRAMGTLASGSTVPAFGASFQNNTGSTLNQINITAVMEQWKTGSSSTVNENVVFEYSLTAKSLDDASATATWLQASGLDLSEILVALTDNKAVDGNAEANRKAISAQLTALNWTNGSTLWIRWKDTNDGGNDGIYAVDDLKIEFESNSTAPVLFAPSSLNLGETIIDTEQKGSYTFTATNLTAPVIVTADAPFLVSKTADGSYTSEIEFTTTELATEATVYVKVVPAEFGIVNGNITHTSTGATTVTVAATVMSHSPYAQDFNTCTGNATIAGGWMQYSVTGAQTWACTTFGTIDPATGKMSNAVQMSGHDGTNNNVNTDWLISPKLDLAGFAIPLVNFNYRTKYAGAALKVVVSTNYSGSGDPTAATWTELASLDADNADEWKLLENLGLQDYKSTSTYIAFVYTSTAEAGARWTLDNFELEGVDNFLTTSNLVLNFPETAAGSKSAAQEFTFSAVGYTTQVVVAAPANFELSTDGTSFSPSLTYTSTEAAANNKVYVRFAPAAPAHLSTGPITFTGGSEAAVTRGMLSGSSMLKSTTLDVVTWNLEWFGSAGNGPDDEALQFENAKKVIIELNADIIGVQEIVDEAKITELATATGYTYVSETMSWQDGADQKVGFLYKPSVVTVKKEKVLLSKLFSDIKNNGVKLDGYPNDRSDFLWSSGRLPYMVEFEATINGVKQTLNVVNLHAKANEDADMFPYNRRKYDVKVLKDSLDAQYANANLIILGDYNDDVDASVVGTNPSTFEPFVIDTDNFETLTYDLSVAGKNTYESGSFKNFLDHIIISKELSDEYVSSSIAVEEQLLSSVANFRTTTSDHLPVSARFTLTADPASVSFTNASVSKTEDAGTFTVSLTLSAAVATEQTVTITPAASSTATAADYTLTGASNGSVTVTIPANATAATFEVNITDDTDVEEAEQVVFEISNPSSGILLGSAKTFTLTIEANDAPTGIADGTKGQFSIYPNPVNANNVRLLLPERVAATAKVSMVVYSSEGRKVMNITGTQDAVQAKLSNRVANLPAGIYMILIETGKEFFQTKMVKN